MKNQISLERHKEIGLILKQMRINLFQLLDDFNERENVCKHIGKMCDYLEKARDQAEKEMYHDHNLLELYPKPKSSPFEGDEYLKVYYGPIKV